MKLPVLASGRLDCWLCLRNCVGLARQPRRDRVLVVVHTLEYGPAETSHSRQSSVLAINHALYQVPVNQLAAGQTVES